MSNTSVIFVGTSDFSVQCLKYLMDTNAFQISALVTTPRSQGGRGMKWHDSDLKIFNQELGLPIFTPELLSSQEFLKDISQFKSQFAIVCAYGKILPNSFLNHFPQPSVNIHPSLLPLWRGAAPIERSLMNGDKKTGVSLQFVGEKLDAGDLVSQVSFSIGENENAEDIYKKAEEASKKLLQEDLVSYLKGDIQAQAQEEEKATYAHKIEKKEAQLVWTKSSHFLHNQVRALMRGPQAFTYFKNQRLKVYKTQIVNKNFSSISPGRVVELDKNHLVISCGEFGLQLLEIQKEGKKKQKVGDFLQGFSMQIGDVFGIEEKS